MICIDKYDSDLQMKACHDEYEVPASERTALSLMILIHRDALHLHHTDLLTLQI